MLVKTVIALCMWVNGSLDGHMLVEGNNISECLKIKRQAERNRSRSQHTKAWRF